VLRSVCFMRMVEKRGVESVRAMLKQKAMHTVTGMTRLITERKSPSSHTYAVSEGNRLAVGAQVVVLKREGTRLTEV
jgi:hypothetical protein